MIKDTLIVISVIAIILGLSLWLVLNSHQRTEQRVCAIDGKQTYLVRGYEYPCPQQDSDQ